MMMFTSCHLLLSCRHQWLLEQHWPLMLKSRRGRLLHHGALAKHRVRVVAAFCVVLVHIELGRLGVLDLKCATSRVDVTAMQGLLRSLGGLQAVKLQHRLHSVLLEDHDSDQFPKRRGDCVEHVAGDRVGGVEDGEEQDMVGLLPLVGPLVQLDVHQLRRQQDGVGGRPHCCCLLLVVRVVVDPRPLRHRRHEVVRVIHVQGHLSACLDMCCGLLVICVPGGMQCGVSCLW